MKGRLKVQNFYTTNLQTDILPGSASDTTEKSFIVAQAPESDSGWVVVDLNDNIKTEIIFYHRKEGNTLYYYDYNRTNPIIRHYTGAVVQINDVAQLFNWIMENTEDFGQVKKLETPGLRVKVNGGNINVNNQNITVSDTVLTLTDNATNYIVFDYLDNTIKALTDVTGFNGVVLAEVITSGGDIQSINDVRKHGLPVIVDGITLNYRNGKLEIPDGAIVNSKIADGAVSTTKIQDGVIINSKLADASVSTTKIQDGAITSEKIANNAVNNTKITDNAISNSKIQDGAVTDNKITGPIQWNKIDKTGSSLNDLDDVDTTGVQDKQGIFYDANTGKWIAGGAIQTDEFTGLIDTPVSYPTDGRTYQVQVKQTNDGLEFTRDIDVNSITKNGAIENQAGGYATIDANGFLTPPSGVQFSDGTQLLSGAPFIFGDGSDGDLIITSGTAYLNLNTVYQFRTINIAAGAVLTTNDIYGNLLIKCKGDFIIDGEINLDGKGRQEYNSYLLGLLKGGSGGNGGDGGAIVYYSVTYKGAGGIGSDLGYGGGGGGGSVSYSSGVYKGGNGGNGGYPPGLGAFNDTGKQGGDAYGGHGKDNYGTTSGNGASGTNSAGGSGAKYTCVGGGGGAGGIGGGGLLLYGYNVVINGIINCNGQNGGNGSNAITCYSYIGTGGGGGGGGGGGFVGIVYIKLIGNNINTNGGQGGLGGTGNVTGSAGQNGNNGIIILQNLNGVNLF